MSSLFTAPFDNSYARLPEHFYSREQPLPVPAPALACANQELARQLQLDPEALARPEDLEVLAGNRVPEGAEPLAMAYAGHQFGNFVPSLGDGRALLLGELLDADGERRDIQLKGSGATAFSRGGDGRAGLPSMIREYLASEAMAGLGIPCQRALALVTTGETVHRETPEPGAVLTRVTRGLVRFGTFQYFHYRDDREALRTLTEYVIRRHYPELVDEATPLPVLLGAVAERTARLVADWMLVGFIHGVMNTDNMTLSGETIDFGPFGFMDEFHPATVFSLIDQGGRYAFNQQPDIAGWNLARFAETLLPLMEAEMNDPVTVAQEQLRRFAPVFEARYEEGLLAKLGLTERREGDSQLIEELFAAMARQRVDYTLLFRRLSEVPGDSADDDEPVRELFSQPEEFDRWAAGWRDRLRRQDRDDKERRSAMRAVNPAFVLRNHHAQRAIDAALAENFEPFHELLTVLASPFEDQPGMEHWTRPPAQEERVPYTTCGT